MLKKLKYQNTKIEVFEMKKSDVLTESYGENSVAKEMGIRWSWGGDSIADQIPEVGNGNK